MFKKNYYKRFISNGGNHLFADVPKRVLFSHIDQRKSETAITDQWIMAQRKWRYFANGVVNIAVKQGNLPNITTQPCDTCGAKAHHYHHHAGYEPKNILNVIPICGSCHNKERVN